MLKELTSLFTSRARTAVLETLATQSAPIHLRLIGTLTAQPIRSIEVALSSLVAERLVKRQRRTKQILYCLNHDHELAPLLLQIVESVKAHQIQERSKQLTQQAKQILPYISSAQHMIETAKKAALERGN